MTLYSKCNKVSTALAYCSACGMQLSHTQRSQLYLRIHSPSTMIALLKCIHEAESWKPKITLQQCLSSTK